MMDGERLSQELQQYRSALAEKEALLTAFSRSMAILELAPDGTILAANDNFLTLMAYQQSDIVGRHHSMLCNPEHAGSPEYAEFWRRLHQGEVVSGTLQRMRSDGSRLWLEATCNPVFDAQGRLQRIISIAADVTAHIDDSQEKNSILRALNRSLGVIEFTADGIIVGANGNYLKTMGYLPAEIVGKHHRFLCEPEYVNSQEYENFWRDVNQGRFFSGRFKRMARDGRPVWWEATYTPVFDVEGKPVKIISIGADVSYRMVREQRDREYQHLLSLGINETDNAVFITNDADHIVFHNTGFSRMLGFAADEVIGRRPRELFEGQPAILKLIDDCYAVIAQGRSFHGEEMMIDKQGHPLWVSTVVNPILDGDGKLINAVSILTDITNAKMHEVLQYKALNAMVREASLHEVLTMVCEELERIAPDVVASILLVDEHGLLHPIAGPSLPEEYNRAIEGIAIGPNVGSCGTAAFRAEPVEVYDIETDPLWTDYKHLVLPMGLQSCWSTPITSADGRVIGTFAFYYYGKRRPDAFHHRLVEISLHLCALALEREETRSRIHQLAFYDALTGLPNRSLLLVKANQAIANAARTKIPLAVLFIDLDRFKQINDSLSHQAGDELLRTVAGRLQIEARKSDIVGRLSGDEFVVVLTQCDLHRVTDVVKRIQANLSLPCQVAGITLTPSASIGISLFPDNGETIEMLLHRADMAMYQTKAKNRGRFSFFSDEMNTQAQERLALEGALRDALRGGDFELHYQPQINFNSGLLHGVEALARWRHPQLGQVSPARFIPIAEECGLIGELGKWALEEACYQLSDWRRRGIDVPSVSVNLSSTNFHDLELPQFIQGLLQRYALAPTDLTLEITETVMMDTNPSTTRTIREVHALGVKLAMDDFGTGYSSLGYLRNLPVCELKLDQSFVRDMNVDDTVLALTSAVIRIGESLHLTVVAEGVENKQQYDLLKLQGCDVAQGYLFSRPMPADNFELWLESFNIDNFLSIPSAP
ncbi:EAL domain-containing protein [Herbaspirillum sp. RV1423]|uniref:sensor domain-containing protein n=1 Tax=Herbaspirillum sp. RV1423 TaxID=1443993 RepID=UPI0004BB2AEE|nr:EAL domain-containing protein [Herbaspirillum sp. RV1423]